LILALVVILLFGSKKLPDAARSLGKSLRIFKSEVREWQNENKASEGSTVAQPTAAQPTVVQSERVEQPHPSSGHTDAKSA